MPVALRPDALNTAIESDRPPVVIDVRPPLDYADAHVPSATLVPRRLLEFRLPTRVPCRSTPIVVCDQRGERAPFDADWLEHLGYHDVSYLEGGVEAWRAARMPTVEAVDGVPTTALHVESKRFGEQVLAEEAVPQLAPAELHRRLADDPDDLLLVDVRVPEEYRDGTIPGAVNAEGVELAGVVASRRGNETVVVNCAARTRSIIGAATLRKLGIRDVYQLENGAMGWTLAGYELAPGTAASANAEREPTSALDEPVESLLDDSGVERLSPAEFAELLDVADVNVYPVDVRTRDEYVAGHIPGTLNIPGGQAIQRADHYIPDRQGRVAFVSERTNRAAVTAHWFSERGYPNVALLDGGIEAWRRADRPLRDGRDRRSPLGAERAAETVEYVKPEALDDSRAGSEVRIVNVDTSREFRRRHVPGSTWIPRYHLDGGLGADPATVVLTCRNGAYSTMAAAALAHRGTTGPSVLRGGLDGWDNAGLPTESGRSGLSREPRDVIPAPWSIGTAAVRTYLAWEEGLVEAEPGPTDGTIE